MTPSKQIKTHSQFDAEDHAYLAAKGWTDAQILARWDQEADAGNGPCRWGGQMAQTKLQAVLKAP
jgi:hypothetical protein